MTHLDTTAEEELNRLLRIVVDVENLFMCVHKEEDAETKQVYFYLFKVGIVSVDFIMPKVKFWLKINCSGLPSFMVFLFFAINQIYVMF